MLAVCLQTGHGPHAHIQLRNRRRWFIQRGRGGSVSQLTEHSCIMLSTNDEVSDHGSFDHVGHFRHLIPALHLPGLHGSICQ